MNLILFAVAALSFTNVIKLANESEVEGFSDELFLLSTLATVGLLFLAVFACILWLP
jgi:hypothetical protein